MKKGISRLLEFLGACLLIGMIIIVLWQIFSRTILGNPNTVTEELVRFGLVWFAMLSSAYVVGQKGHLAVTLLSEKLTGKKANILEIIVQCLFFCRNDHGLWWLECCHLDNGPTLTFVRDSDGLCLFIGAGLRYFAHYLQFDQFD